jgi:hypothetical protein
VPEGNKPSGTIVLTPNILANLSTNITISTAGIYNFQREIHVGGRLRLQKTSGLFLMALGLKLFPVYLIRFKNRPNLREKFIGAKALLG